MPDLGAVASPDHSRTLFSESLCLVDTPEDRHDELIKGVDPYLEVYPSWSSHPARVCCSVWRKFISAGC